MNTTRKMISKIRRWGGSARVGLALSGGTTYGAAHVGVLQVLEESGIKPDVVAGTSAGALVGAAYCAGIALDEIENLFLDMDWPTLIKLSLLRPLSIFDTQPMEKFLEQKIGNLTFEELRLPFAVVTCDIQTGKKVVIQKGPVVPAVRASAAIPALFPPIEIDGHLLVDGGMVDNLPVEEVFELGADYIIASDVSRRDASSKKPENAFEILLTTFYILQARGALVSEDASDCYIRPMVSQYSSWGFKDVPKMLAAGRIAARAKIPKIKRNLRLK